MVKMPWCVPTHRGASCWRRGAQTRWPEPNGPVASRRQVRHTTEAVPAPSRGRSGSLHLRELPRVASHIRGNTNVKQFDKHIAREGTCWTWRDDMKVAD